MLTGVAAATRRMHTHTRPHTQVLDNYEDIKLGALHGIDAKKVGYQVALTVA